MRYRVRPRLHLALFRQDYRRAALSDRYIDCPKRYHQGDRRSHGNGMSNLSRTCTAASARSSILTADTALSPCLDRDNHRSKWRPSGRSGENFGCHGSYCSPKGSVSVGSNFLL